MLELMIGVYKDLILAGKKTIWDVPEKDKYGNAIRSRVIDLLISLGKEEYVNVPNPDEIKPDEEVTA
jgi:hypothetical protein